MDICIYTMPDTLTNKRGLNRDGIDCYEYYWRLRRTPKNLKAGEKIYFATKGMLRGYFIVDHIEKLDEDHCEITFRKETWEGVISKPIVRFRGFKYMEED